jgi:chlorite dismutase
MTDESVPLSPSVGWGVLHLFGKPSPQVDGEAIVAAVKRATGATDGLQFTEGPAHRGEHQVVCAALLGHKADVALMALGPDLWRLRQLQTDVQRAGLDVVDSYTSITEVSEYAKGMPQEHLDQRLYPQLPPAGKRAFCFYPMSKRRNPAQNWFTLPYEQRAGLMQAHGKSGRLFAGRIVQLITGSTGLDDFEWGVTLFGVRPDDLKDVVYTMRFDEASAIYAEFGPFYVGAVCPVEELVERVLGR